MMDAQKSGDLATAARAHPPTLHCSLVLLSAVLLSGSSVRTPLHCTLQFDGFAPQEKPWISTALYLPDDSEGPSAANWIGALQVVSGVSARSPASLLAPKEQTLASSFTKPAGASSQGSDPEAGPQEATAELFRDRDQPLICGTGSRVSNSSLFASKGWFRSDTTWATLGDQLAVMASNPLGSTLRRVVRDDRKHRGKHELSFECNNLGPGAAGNLLEIRVWGCNGEFIQGDSHPLEWSKADLAHDRRLLLARELGGQEVAASSFAEPIDLGSGFDCVVVEIRSRGVDRSQGDVQTLRAISLKPAATAPDRK